MNIDSKWLDAFDRRPCKLASSEFGRTAEIRVALNRDLSCVAPRAKKERPITPKQPNSSATTAYADLYKYGCFILETKQRALIMPMIDRRKNIYTLQTIPCEHPSCSDPAYTSPP